jgi:hypothetical protein
MGQKISREKATWKTYSYVEGRLILKWILEK